MSPSLKNNLIASVIAVLAAASLFLFFPKEPPPPVQTVRVTIPEGFTLVQIAKRLEGFGMFPAEDFLKTASGEEGFLFPDTYEFFKESSPEAVVRKMKENFSKKVGAKISRDVIIMASLLEEEASSERDRKIISGILWKRIEAGLPLQVDATLTYVTGRASRELTEEDLNLSSPYNTYKILGLPLGPISNPGLQAIEAALNPEPSPYWFYLSDKNGDIHYAKNFEEHKLNKEKYLR